jgi:hypothetical protein
MQSKTSTLRSSMRSFERSTKRHVAEKNELVARYMQYVYLANDGSYKDRRTGKSLLTYEEYINKNRPWT